MAGPLGRRPGGPVPAARPGPRREHREGCRRAGAGKTASPSRPVRPASTSPPPLRRFDTGTGKSPPGGQRARKFTSSQVTLMIRKEGTYVRVMTIAPARQLMLDIPWPERDGGRDRERVWNQMPDAARARVLRLLAAMIAAGVLAGDDAGQDAGAVRGDG